MNVSTALSYVPTAARHLAGELRDALYVRSGGKLDWTKPRSFYGILNERCNLKCQGCHYWRLPHYAPELTAEQWCRALADIKSFVGPYHINFSGGEPLVKKGVFEILNYCRDHGILAGLTTNGMIVKDRQAAQLVEARLFNLSVSLDGATAQTHDLVRGVPGSYDRVLLTVRLMRAHAERHGLTQRIILKATINRCNVTEMPALVRLAQDLGAAVLLQPLSDWGMDETADLWIRDEAQLRKVIDELIALREQGAPILNQDAHLLDMPRHFRHEKVESIDSEIKCWVGLQTVIIKTTGTVHNCHSWPALGNIVQQSMRDIWSSESSRRQRADSTQCVVGCMSNCHKKRSLVEKARTVLSIK